MIYRSRLDVLFCAPSLTGLHSVDARIIAPLERVVLEGSSSGLPSDGGPPRPPSSMLRSHVVAANARIDCTTRNRARANLNIEIGGGGGGAVATTTVPNIGRGPLSTIPGGAIIRASTDSDSLQFESVGIVFISFASPSDLRKLGTDAPGGSGRRLVDRRPQAQPQPPPLITAGPAAQGRKHGRKHVVGGA